MRTSKRVTAPKRVRDLSADGAQVQTSPMERWVVAFLIFSYASGALAHLLPSVLPLTRYITDLLLFFLNGLVLYTIYSRNRDERLWRWLAGAYVFTFAAEALGVATGAIFGEYAYGPTMWMQWLGVPFVIALNWCMLCLAANQVVGSGWNVRATDPVAASLKGPLRTVGIVAVSLGAGILVALYDVAIEPVAIKLNYWSWAAGDIPLRNYLAWALIGFLISLPLRASGIRFRSPVLPVYFFAQLGFFLLLNLFL